VSVTSAPVPDPPPTWVLDIRELSVVRERRRLISDVSLDVVPGTVHCLVGPNGAGKSTLFGAILGLVEFDGSIRFCWRASGRIGYVPQSFVVDRTLPLTVVELLATSRQRRPVCFGVGRAMRRRVDALLAEVGLEGFLDRPLWALSGGELQRVLLANALDPEPELLLLDEPGSGLDENAVRRFEEILLRQCSVLGAGALMVSHDLAQVRRIAHDVTLIDRVVRASGPPTEVLRGDLASALIAR
jgi:zinc transport system ATP-binding protein